jgi:hypothetical protein
MLAFKCDGVEVKLADDAFDFRGHEEFAAAESEYQNGQDSQGEGGFEQEPACAARGWAVQMESHVRQD